MVPRLRGGTDHEGNLQLLCGAWNRINGDTGTKCTWRCA